MLKEEKIKEMIEEELLWLEKFASTEKTNIHKDNIVEVDRRIYRMSTLYEVLGEVPSKDAIYILNVIKEKLQ